MKLAECFLDIRHIGVTADLVVDPTGSRGKANATRRRPELSRHLDRCQGLTVDCGNFRFSLSLSLTHSFVRDRHREYRALVAIGDLGRCVCVF